MLKTKYIAYSNGIFVDMVVFSNLETHADIAQLGRLKVVSAGFININIKNGNPVAHCYGESISLGVSSRVEDSEIANRVLGLDRL